MALEEERYTSGKGSGASGFSFFRPWRCLSPIPHPEIYVAFVVFALALAYASGVILLPQISLDKAEARVDWVSVCSACLIPALALWFSFWCVGAAVQQGAARVYGYLPVGITLFANILVWLTVYFRAEDPRYYGWMFVNVAVAWVVQVCLIINPCNCLCGLAGFAAREDAAALRTFFSKDRSSPELPLAHIYVSPTFYTAVAGSVGVLLLIPEFIGLANGWMKYESAFQGAIICAAIRDLSLGMTAAGSIAWYQSGLAFLRGFVNGETPPPSENCTLQIQYLPRHQETLLSFYLPNGKVGGRGSCGNGDFAKRLVSKFDKLLKKTEEIVGASPCYRFRNSAAMPDPATFEKFLSDIGSEIAKHYFISDVRTAVESFESVVSRNRESFVMQILCDESCDVIPWELLLFRGKFLCSQFPMVRVRSIERPVTMPKGQPHCVVVGASAMEGSEVFCKLPDVNNEVRVVQETLEQAGWKVTVLVDEEARIEKVREAFSQSGRVDVFHFTGHSQFSPSDLDHSFLRLHNDSRLYASRLIDLVRLRNPWLAFLNGCESARSGLFAANSVRGLTDAMNEADVHYVLGMRWPITSTAGNVLARSFYQGLTEGKCPELALWQARLQAALSDTYDDPSWGAPCLYRN